VWTVKSGKFDIVKKYIEDSIPEITKVLYPTVTSEKHSAKGEVKTKKTPLYAGYLFLRYEHKPDSPKVWISLNKHPFITGYVGPCTPKDLVSVDSLQKVESVSLEAVKNFEEGDSVLVNGGVFKGMTGKVVGLSSNLIKVEITMLGRPGAVPFSPEDLDIVTRCSDKKKK
jgi:transcriptional antiterminator NusG